ncbi:MAG: DUF4388 domain-containing protein [Nitrospirota bacterium]|nr:DUF4388 domain-containing protein [Nitrospirota bacterium]
MALEGTLKDFSPFDIMELIGFKQKTGLLFVTAPEGETITLGFEKKGLVLAQSSTKKNDLQLGNILLRAGKITEANRDKALEMQKGTLDRLGFIFAREKYCTEKDICESLRIQIKRVFFTLLRWTEGIYIFEPRESIDYFHEFIKPVFVQPLSVKGLMMEGAVMIDEWPMVEKVVKSLDMVFRRLPVKQEIKTLTEEEAFDFEGSATKNDSVIQLTPDEKILYDLTDGHQSVSSILEKTLFSEFTCCKTIFDLVKKDLLEENKEAPLEVSLPSKKDAASGDVLSDEIVRENWEAARVLVQRALPEALILEITLSEKKATLLQGETDLEQWPDLIMAIYQEAKPLGNRSDVGVFEYVADEVGIALFWDHRADYMFVVVSALNGSIGASRFRAHVATVTRCVIV